MFRFFSSALVVGIMLGWITASGAIAAAPCSRGSSGGGEWPMYGHDLAGTRDQSSELSLPPAAVGHLKPVWVFKTATAGDGSAFETNPVVDGGCAFIGSAAGNVYAVDMTRGALVWKRHLNVPSPGLGGAIVGAPAVAGDEVVVLVNESSGPYVIALDRASGGVLWQSGPVVSGSGYYSNASPILANGLVVVGYSPPEGDSTGQGGFALLDATTGALVARTQTITHADQAKGYAGGGLWSTPAYDAATGYLYWGTGNPYSKTKEDPHTNAILKIDLNRGDASFAQVVASYKGNVDQYSQTLEQLSQTPACAASADSPLPYPLDDPVCGQLDLDFGASANLFSAGGVEMIGELQKSGIYHVARADSMAPRWSTIIGLSCQFCNAASTAVDASGIYGVGTPGGIMYALNPKTGAVRWRQPILDGAQYQPTSVADGVVFTVDGNGFLDAYGADTGTLLLHRSTAIDAGAPPPSGATSNGVTIAEHTVLVATTSTASAALGVGGSNTPSVPGGSGSFLIAYRR